MKLTAEQLEPSELGRFLMYLKDKGIEPSAREVMRFCSHYNILTAHTEPEDEKITAEQRDWILLAAKKVYSIQGDDGESDYIYIDDLESLLNDRTALTEPEDWTEQNRKDLAEATSIAFNTEPEDGK